MAAVAVKDLDMDWIEKRVYGVTGVRRSQSVYPKASSHRMPWSSTTAIASPGICPPACAEGSPSDILR